MNRYVFIPLACIVFGYLGLVWWACQGAQMLDAAGNNASTGSNPQGQLPLKRCVAKDFKQEVFAPAASAAFHDEAGLARVLLQ